MLNCPSKIEKSGAAYAPRFEATRILYQLHAISIFISQIKKRPPKL